jgi:uncharacterized protein (DUF1800 family)
MKKISYAFFFLCLALTGTILISSYKQHPAPSYQFPYKQAGLTEREAAAHLLNRFTFGATPGQVDQVVKMGLENWFDQQLNASAEDKKIESMLEKFPSLKMTNAEIVETYPKPGQILRMAIKDGAVDKDIEKDDKKESREAIRVYMEKKGLKPYGELLRDLASQKFLRAAYSNNQLKEVMVDFWFNHFNVAASKGSVTQFVTGYERDAIRQNVFSDFETLLIATAKSPAMLNYLDNSKSSVNEEFMVDEQKKMVARKEKAADKIKNDQVRAAVKMQGLNENYAREIMELHTLGVDGGYAQSDVTQAARILTGWNINPQIEYNVNLKKLPSINRLEKMGFVIEKDFVFAMNRHDLGEKKVLGRTFPAGRGYDEGVELIKMLAAHPSTANFISKKLATRFVSDNPPQALIDKMAKTFTAKQGNIKELLITLVSSPEFWDKENIREKTKSPFELAISAIRATNAEIIAPLQLYQWVNRMGQKVYDYQAPTGFPDRGQYWINTGSLLNRMNFGLAFASGKIPGIKVNLSALNNNREPESGEHALRVYASLLLPERNLEETIKRLSPMLTDPELEKKVREAAEKTETARSADMQHEEEMMMGDDKKKKQAGRKENNDQMQSSDTGMLAQVVGVILGSPEFQRR